MDLMKLTARLVLDTSEYEASLGGLESETTRGRFSAWGVAMGNVAAKAFSTAFSMLTNFGKSVLETGMEFDSMMSYVQALSGAEGEQFESLRNRAIELGETTVFTATQVGEAFSYMALAGWSTDEMLEGIAGILDLAAASGEDLGRVSDIVTDALTAFGLTAKDAGHFVDVLAAASANSNTTVAQMGEAFKYLATTGGVLGYTIDDVALTLGLLANNGIKAGQAGTSMRKVLNTLIAPSDKAAKAMENLGLYLFDPYTDKRKPLSQVVSELRDIFKNSGFDLEGQSIEQVIEKIKKLDERYAGLFEQFDNGKKSLDLVNIHGMFEEMTYDEVVSSYESELREITGFNEAFLANLSAIGGLRGISSIFALMNSTDADLNQLSEAIEGSEDAAQTMAQTMLDNLKGDITLLNSAMDGLKILISDDFKSSFRSFVSELITGVGKISEAFSEGGLSGMFISLTDWVINGITSALRDPMITRDGANDFGKALGDFVGHLVSTLVTSAPQLVSGLFEAGLNLAGGLVEGLFAGLFGTGEGSLAGMLNRTQDEQEDAIAKANTTAAEASGIVSYMDSLVVKYGQAASSTAEWAGALERLKTVMPEINTLIATQSGSLEDTNAAIREYISNARSKAIEDARQAALASYTENYVNAVRDLGIAQINRDIAESTANEARQALIDYIQQYEEGYTGNGATIDQIAHVARSYANEHGDMTNTSIQALVDQYNTNIATMSQLDSEIVSLSSSAEGLQTAMETAQKALASLASAASSAASTAGSWVPYGQWANNYYSSHSHAKGLNYVPWDNYVAQLHRGEMVLNRSQAENYRGRNRELDMDALTAAVAEAVAAAVGNIQINMSGRAVGNAVSGQVSRNIYHDQRGRRVGT